MMKVTSLNFDVLLRIVRYLDMRDVFNLCKVNKWLRYVYSDYDLWAAFGRALVRRGTAIPTTGFKTADDLSKDELRASIAKAIRIERAWSRTSARASRITFIKRNQELLGRVEMYPLTSDLAIAVSFGELKSISDKITICDIECGQMVGHIHGPYSCRDSPTSTFALDVKTKMLYLMPHRDYGEPTILNKVDLSEIKQDHSRDVVPTLAITSILLYSFPLQTCGVFILDTVNRKMCEVFKGTKIFLFFVFDWDERSIAFIDTGLEAQGQIIRGRGYSSICVWDKERNSLILEFEAETSSISQHVYHASQLETHIISLDSFIRRPFSVDRLPVVLPQQSRILRHDREYSTNYYGPLFAARTHWHVFSGVTSPAPSVYALYSALCLEPPEPENITLLTRLGIKKPPRKACFHGHLYMHCPASGVPLSPEATVNEAIVKAPMYHSFVGIRSFWVEYGGIAWSAVENGPSLKDVVLRVARFADIEQMPGQTERVPACKVLPPPGYKALRSASYYDDRSLLSLDVVHGKVFFTGYDDTIVILHYD